MSALISPFRSIANLMEGEGISTLGIFAIDGDQHLTPEQYEMVKEKRRHPDNIKWTYCIVFPAEPIQKKKGLLGCVQRFEKGYGKTAETLLEERMSVLRALHDASFKLRLFYSADKKKIFCKVGATDHRFLEVAEAYNYKLKLNEKSAKVALEEEDVLADGSKRLPVYLDYPYPKDVVEDKDNEHLKYLLGQYKSLGSSGVENTLSMSTIKKKLHEQTKYSPFSNIYIPYNMAAEERIVRDHGVQIFKYYGSEILRTYDRIKLSQLAIDGKQLALEGAKGAELDLERLKIAGVILGAFPVCFSETLAEAEELTVDELHSRWSKSAWRPWRQPIADIRDYCGEKIAFYFAFLGFYTLWLAPAALVGAGMFAWQLYELYIQLDTFDFVFSSARVESLPNGSLVLDAQGNIQVTAPTEVFGLPYYALFISLWGTFFLEYWKRYENKLALAWGMTNYQREAVIRPEFKPTYVLPSPETGLPEFYRSPFWFGFKLALSFSTVLFFVVTVVAAIFGTLVFKVLMEEANIFGEFVSVQVALALNALIIMVLNFVFKMTAKRLNDWENHRTDLEYEDSLILKTFVFTFCNSYTTLAYYAFVKRGFFLVERPQFCLPELQVAASLELYPVEQLQAADSCFASVGYSLLILFGVQIFVSNAVEVIVPYAQGQIKRYFTIPKAIAKKRKKKAASVAVRRHPDEEKAEEPEEEMDDILESLVSPAEQQYFLNEYETPFTDYLEIAIQFGYVTLFVAAFPLAPVFAWLSAYVELRIDSGKVCFLSRRPDPTSAQNIGKWINVFTALSFISVCSNAAILIFTVQSPIITDAPYESPFRVWLFVLFIFGVYLFKFIADYFIVDEPASVRIQKGRTRHIMRKVFLVEPDTKFDDEDKETPEEFAEEIAVAPYDDLIDYMLKKTRHTIIEWSGVRGESLQDLSNRIFKSADRNDDKELSIKELKHILLGPRYGQPLKGMTKFESKLIIDAMDVNKDGVISKSEFDKFLIGDGEDSTTSARDVTVPSI